MSALSSASSNFKDTEGNEWAVRIGLRVDLLPRTPTPMDMIAINVVERKLVQMCVEDLEVLMDALSND
jgi:hypothetical protein